MADERQVTNKEAEEAALNKLPDDNSLVTLKTQWVKDCEDYHSELVLRSDDAWKYYKGDQTQLDMLAGYESDAVENRVFLATETALPYVTARIPSVNVTPPQFNEEAVRQANQVGKVIEYYFDEAELKKKSEVSIRRLFNDKFFVWHVFWDDEKDQPDFRLVPARRCWFPKNAANGLPYFIELQEYWLDELTDAFGDEAKNKVDTKDPGTFKFNAPATGKYYVWCVWTKRWVAYFGKEGVLKKMRNPYWRTEDTDGTKVEKNEQKKHNHFNAPEIPYIVGTIFEDGEETVGLTSNTLQTIPIQDVINKVIRYYVDYLEEVGDADVLIDSQVGVTKEQVDNWRAEHGRTMIGKGIANPAYYRRDPPPPMPAFVRDLLVLAQTSFDNIFGMHSTSRGERGEPKTLGEAQLLKESDFGRLDLPARVLGRAVGKLGNWFLQLIVVYADEKRDVPILDASEEMAFVSAFNREMVQKGLKLKVKEGSSLPDDKVSRASVYLTLAKLGLIRPLDLYKALDLPDPEGLEDNLIKFKNNQVGPSAPAPVAGGNGMAVPPTATPSEAPPELSTAPPAT